MRSPTSRRCCPYTPAYRRAEILDRYDDGRPHHVRLAIRVLGRLDEEILEFRWGPDWLVWDAERTKQQYAQHVEYRLAARSHRDVDRGPGRHHRRARFAHPGLPHQAGGQDDHRCGERGAAQSSAARQGFRSSRVDRNSRIGRAGWSQYADRNRVVSQPASNQSSSMTWWRRPRRAYDLGVRQVWLSQQNDHDAIALAAAGRRGRAGARCRHVGGADQPASPADRRVSGADGAGCVARKLQPRTRSRRASA